MDGLMISFCLSMFTLVFIQLAQSASLYSNRDIDFISTPSFEPLCNEQHERFVESDGKESSLILELHPGLSARGSCKRIFSAPESHGFIVRLIRPKIKRIYHNGHSGPLSKNNVRESSEKNTNSTKTCPLSIFSSIDPLIPSWRIDPCQLEETNDIEDPVRLFQGRLKVIWDHGGHNIASKLMVTVLGKGVACQEPNKHPCLKIGTEALLCISKDLVCDGIRHCPNSNNEYDSDEDYKMCSKRRKFDPAMESDIWEHWTIEIFRNLFSTDTTNMLPATTKPTTTTSSPTTQLTNVQTKIGEKGLPKAGAGVETEMGTTKRNTTRLGLSSDLSKYGPWGYLMLGMLLCGGALLICGLWASASNSESESDTSVHQASMSHEHQAPPNYEELDPPPAYSALFPNQKASSADPSSSMEAVETTIATSSNPAEPQQTVAGATMTVIS